MSFKGKAKISAIACFRIITFIPVVLLLVVLQTAAAVKNEILPEVFDCAKSDWDDIVFNVKKLF